MGYWKAILERETRFPRADLAASFSMYENRYVVVLSKCRPVAYRWAVNDDLIGKKGGEGGVARGRKSTSCALRLALLSSQRQPSPEEPPHREGPTASAACKFGFLDLEVITGPKLFNVVVSTRGNRLEGITIPQHVPQWEKKRRLAASD